MRTPALVLLTAAGLFAWSAASAQAPRASAGRATTLREVVVVAGPAVRDLTPVDVGIVETPSPPCEPGAALTSRIHGINTCVQGGPAIVIAPEAFQRMLAEHQPPAPDFRPAWQPWALDNQQANTRSLVHPSSPHEAGRP